MKYLCTNCNYTFDEALWDPSEWIEAWVKKTEEFVCPVCNEEDTFYHIDEEITYIEDDTNDILEMDHFIEIKHDNFQFEVNIWDNVHPMGENHRIAWIWLFDEYWEMVDEKFLEIETDSTVLFDDYDLDTFEIRVKCSQHQLFAKKFEL